MTLTREQSYAVLRSSPNGGMLNITCGAAVEACPAGAADARGEHAVAGLCACRSLPDAGTRGNRNAFPRKKFDSARPDYSVNRNSTWGACGRLTRQRPWRAESRVCTHQPQRDPG